MTIKFEEIIPKFDAILERGLCKGAGSPDGQMCIEAAITQAMGLPFSDEPECVSNAVREFKIRLNDSDRWVSPQSRAKALRSLGIAQIGSKGIVSDVEFTKRLAEKITRKLLPQLFRKIFPNDEKLLAVALRCEQEGTANAAAYAAANAAAYAAANAAAYAAANAAAYAAYAAANAAAYAASAANAAAYAAANAAANAANAASVADKTNPEKYLVLVADLALEVLRELKSPGCEWLDWRAA